MKKIIYGFGIIFIAIVIIVNLVFSAKLDNSEHITIDFNSFIYIIGIIIGSMIIFEITRIINDYLCKENKKKLRTVLFIVSFTVYILSNIVWVIAIKPPIVGDQIHACNLAQTFYNNNVEEFLPNTTYAGIPLRDYMQAYHQQISLSFVFSLFFRIIHFDGIGILRALNVIGNILIVFSLYKIGVQLSKKYKTNSVLLLTLILTFFSLIMLNTFIYGDIPSLGLCLLAVYFMMKYTENKKISYSIWASIFTMIAYMMRMNCLIFIIATVIYLILNLVKEFKIVLWKEKLVYIAVIVMYICISIIPAGFVKSYYLTKFDMDKNKAYPNISYFLMAMEESWRGNGWYSEDIGEHALKEPEIAKEEYKEKIKDRLTYFAKNPGEAFDFYVKKIASMWSENTYSAVRSNLVKENDPLENIYEPLETYQKILLVLTCICALIVLIQNRKNLSLDLLFLITIFIGGFAFHILWEAKSRYIIPYIVVLIPVASITINNLKFGKNKDI